ncbi:oxidoreductase NAD-binding domain-containing protein 1 isoform X4 [Mycteria americana]|uniref:oxidoreductase NAD-binding domain-containing protein 1 isoform X4 n=1 Tax=Mycteria americana TaxID=33587 RepID=UPI003F587902
MACLPYSVIAGVAKAYPYVTFQSVETHVWFTLTLKKNVVIYSNSIFYQLEKDICHQRALQFNRVDFFIPGVSVVGGFSICSSPGLLEREGILELAVKHTVHPPAYWIHTECTLGSEVALRVGGDFFFDPQPGDSPVKLVLIAGGVGINPLFSILLHIADLHGYQEGKGKGYKMGTVKLYYSAKNTSELLFKENILGLMNAFPGKITCRFHVTQQTSQICKELQPHVKEGRISEKDLEKHASKDTLWYICGPPPMIESISKLLSNIGVPRNCVFFEKWW